MEGLGISRSVASVTREEIESLKFWQASGIKGFSSFSKQYKHVELEKDSAGYVITSFIRAEDGSYIRKQGEDASDRFPCDIAMVQLAKIVQEKMAGGTVAKTSLKQTFITLNNSRVEYILPNECVMQIGDAHTDAYQTIISEDYPANHIAFCIGTTYDSVDKKGIRKRWRKMFGKLGGFQYKESREELIKLSVTARTDSLTISSYFYADGDDFLEVMMVLDKEKTPEDEQRRIKKVFLTIVDSVIVQENTEKQVLLYVQYNNLNHPVEVNLRDDGENVGIELSFRGKRYESEADNYFDALKMLRIQMEKNGLQIICNGAAKNVYPSPMMMQMGDGRKAYLLKNGIQARTADVVDIFGMDAASLVCSVKEQDEYYAEWLSSLRK